MLTSGAVLLHDNARPHIAARMRAPLEHFNWELFDHPLYSPDLAPSDYHLFTYLKNWFGSQHFSNNEELIRGVKTWLNSQAYKNLFPDTSASIPAVTTLRSSLSMYVFFVYNNFFSLVACFRKRFPEAAFQIALISVRSNQSKPKIFILWLASAGH
jgi:hypothetical protein